MMQLVTHKNDNPYGDIVRVLNFNPFYPNAKTYLVLGKGI
jgi:hypothetical protein